MYPDLFEFLCRSQSTCHCLLYCLKKINMEALLLGMYYFMCKCAFYQLRLVRVYLNSVFGQRRNSSLLLRFLRNLRPSRGPSWPVFSLFFFSVKFVILAIFVVFSTRCFQVGRKILVTFALFAGFSGPFFVFSLSKSRILSNWLFQLPL